MNIKESGIEQSLTRLNAALDAFEAALMRRKQTTQTVETLNKEIETLTEDRSNLAQELDKVRAFASQLDKIQGKAGQRLDVAMDNIRAALENS